MANSLAKDLAFPEINLTSSNGEPFILESFRNEFIFWK